MTVEDDIEFLKDTIVACQDFLRGLRVSSDCGDGHGLIRMYLCTLTEHGYSYVYLFEGKKRAGLGAVARSVLEGYCKLKYLIEHSGNPRELELEFHAQERKLLLGFERNGHVLDNRLKDRIPWHDAKISALEAQHSKSPSKFKLIESAGYSSLYDTVYNNLSDEAHLGIRFVWSRHHDPHSGQIVLFDEFDPELVSSTTFGVSSLLLDALSAVCAYFEKPTDAFDGLIQRFADGIDQESGSGHDKTTMATS